MKRLSQPSVPERWPDDIDRLVAVAQQAGYQLDRSAAAWAWEEHSESLAAGWLSLDNYTARDLLSRLRFYLVEVHDA